MSYPSAEGVAFLKYARRWNRPMNFTAALTPPFLRSIFRYDPDEPRLYKLGEPIEWDKRISAGAVFTTQMKVILMLLGELREGERGIHRDSKFDPLSLDKIQVYNRELQPLEVRLQRARIIFSMPLVVSPENEMLLYDHNRACYREKHFDPEVFTDFYADYLNYREELFNEYVDYHIGNKTEEPRPFEPPPLFNEYCARHWSGKFFVEPHEPTDEETLEYVASIEAREEKNQQAPESTLSIDEQVRRLLEK